MCEILVKAIDVIHSNSKKDKSCYKRGDIVDVRPDGHLWGKEERLPRFVIIKIPDISDKDYMHLMESYYVDSGLVSPDGKKIIDMEFRRQWKVRIDDTPEEIKDKLDKDGEVSVKWSEINSYVTDKVIKSKHL